MTNEELSTAAEVQATENGKGIFWQSNYETVEEGDELVRRKDVEKLIEDKIDEFNEGRPPEYPQKALKEVLDEVQGQ